MFGLRNLLLGLLSLLFIYSSVFGAAESERFYINTAGAAATPSYTFDPDTNTGIYNAIADYLQFSTGGVEALRLDNSQDAYFYGDIAYVGGLTASRLIASDAAKKLVSTDIVSWISGTANQITVTDDADGTITLSIAQHAREIQPSLVIPSNGVTAGVNNTYWAAGSIFHGTTSHGNSQTIIHFYLPDDYVDGSNMTFKFGGFVFLGGAGNYTIDYTITSYRWTDGAAPSVEDTDGPAQFTWSGDVLHFEEITVTGTNYDAGDIVSIRVSMDDNGATNSLIELVRVLEIQVTALN